MLKKSKGLKSRIIEFGKFNNRVFNDQMIEKSQKIFTKIMKGIQKAVRDYKKALKTPPGEKKLASKEFWDEVDKKAKSLGIGLIGFAPVDENLIFQNDYVGGIKVLYETGIVLGMEMDFESIDAAPEPPQGLESLRIYGELGIATNELADFIRSKGFKAIACHPLGGPILYPAMAVKANLGEIGRQGLLISKEYGPRQRLSMIATNALPIPEKSHEDFKIAEFCEKCGKCIKECPVDAILEEPNVKENGIITRIDGKTCIKYFYETAGCSICIKVCPFHKLGYDKVIKEK